MTHKTRAFDLLARMPRDFSAKDLEVRTDLPKPREVIAQLRQDGQLTRTFRLGREQYYAVQQDAPKPVDGREEQARVAAKASLTKRKRRSIVARARAMRRAKLLKVVP